MSSGNFPTPMLVGGAAMVVATTLGCSAADRPAPTVSAGCQAGIEYQGRTYDGDAAYGMFHLKGSSSAKAIRAVSDLLSIYLSEAASLCDQRHRGDLSPADYTTKRQALAMRFAMLAALQKRQPAQGVAAQDAEAYLETLQLIGAPDAAALQMNVQVLVYGDDGSARIVTADEALKSGDEFAIEIRVREPIHLYVTAEGSSRVAVRLYPPVVAGTAGPVNGMVRLPPDPNQRFKLDTTRGAERIHIYGSKRSSPEIERRLAALDEVRRDGDDARQITRSIGDIFRSRDLFQVNRPGAGSADGGLALEGHSVITHELLLKHE